ncbi:MAG: hypothetical protein HQK76_07505 [Desulfobacterales bacterium]|nr:hypothetical protein [Desulfobacterales bacterium]
MSKVLAFLLIFNFLNESLAQDLKNNNQEGGLAVETILTTSLIMGVSHLLHITGMTRQMYSILDLSSFRGKSENRLDFLTLTRNPENMTTLFWIPD